MSPGLEVKKLGPLSSPSTQQLRLRPQIDDRKHLHSITVTIQSQIINKTYILLILILIYN